VIDPGGEGRPDLKLKRASHHLEHRHPNIKKIATVSNVVRRLTLGHLFRGSICGPTSGPAVGRE
jgi:hypothetical protein